MAKSPCCAASSVRYEMTVTATGADFCEAVKMEIRLRYKQCQSLINRIMQQVTRACTHGTHP